jgi:hypothetical protein
MNQVRHVVGWVQGSMGPAASLQTDTGVRRLFGERSPGDALSKI